MNSTIIIGLAPLAIPFVMVALAVAAQVASNLATQSTARHATRVAQIEGTVSRVAGDIAAKLVGVAANTPADVLTALKNAAVAEGATYIATAMPTTVKATGATPETLIAMISGEVGKQLVAAGTAPATVAAAPAPAPTSAVG